MSSPVPQLSWFEANQQALGDALNRLVKVISPRSRASSYEELHNANELIRQSEYRAILKANAVLVRQSHQSLPRSDSYFFPDEFFDQLATVESSEDLFKLIETKFEANKRQQITELTCLRDYDLLCLMNHVLTHIRDNHTLLRFEPSKVDFDGIANRVKVALCRTGILAKCESPLAEGAALIRRASARFLESPASRSPSLAPTVPAVSATAASVDPNDLRDAVCDFPASRSRSDSRAYSHSSIQEGLNAASADQESRQQQELDQKLECYKSDTRLPQTVRDLLTSNDLNAQYEQIFNRRTFLDMVRRYQEYERVMAQQLNSYVVLLKQEGFWPNEKPNFLTRNLAGYGPRIAAVSRSRNRDLAVRIAMYDDLLDTLKKLQNFPIIQPSVAKPASTPVPPVVPERQKIDYSILIRVLREFIENKTLWVVFLLWWSKSFKAAHERATTFLGALEEYQKNNYEKDMLIQPFRKLTQIRSECIFKKHVNEAVTHLVTEAEKCEPFNPRTMHSR